MPFGPIAVVGQSCLLPGAHTPADLWRAVVEGRDLLTAAPAKRWGIARRRILSEFVGDEKDCAFSDRGGYVSGFERIFDPTGFAAPESEMRDLDPLFLWVLHTTREALRDARQAPGPRVGLVLGNLSFPCSALSRFAEATWLGTPAPDPRNRFMSGLPAHLAARALGLGPAFSLDAACASSLYALKLACDRLHDGSADAMLAAAVNRADDLFIHVGFSALQALSRSGRSRPFHREADGLVPAEGAACVVLKRLDDALRDGQEILGVIRGIGLSNDGRGAGILAPSEAGQRRALNAAYASAGLAPERVSLIECHATGTSVGDATELRSTASVYAACREVPIGSLKSNLGHSITVAGLAGLLKLLGAIRAGIRPPTLHAGDPSAALAGSPFRLLTAAEAWEGARRAGLSAFGFGGNNAHVIVEQWTGASHDRVAVAAACPSAEAIAVVGLGVIAAGAPDAAAFSKALFGGTSQLADVGTGRVAGSVAEVAFDPAWLRFPPRDLEAALPQQLLLLRAAGDAVAEAGPLDRERTSALIGMQCDADVARYGARWRLAEWAEALGVESSAWLEAARLRFTPALSAAGVVGTMPNICANRLNSQFDWRAPSFTVSAEELSGVVALMLAMHALRAREIDAAIVGAVEVGSNAVNDAASRSILPDDRHTPGDAAVVLVLKRQADAEREGSNVLALLDEAVLDAVAAPAAASILAAQFGHAHAASGLLEIAARVLSLRHRAAARGVGRRAEPVLGTCREAVLVSALGGAHGRVALRAANEALPLFLEAPARVHVYSGANRSEVLAALEARRESSDGPARLAIVAADAAEWKARSEAARARLAAGEAGALADGVSFFEEPLTTAGELAFVFAAPAGSYRGMGRDLAFAFPKLLSALEERFRGVSELAGWIYDGGKGDADPEQKLWGSAYLCQLHAELSRGVLGLKPAAAIGFSSGETNALFALGAWQDVDAMAADIRSARVYTHELAGRFDAVRRHRSVGADAEIRWQSLRVLAPRDALDAALAHEPLVNLSIVNAPGDFVIAGDADGCERVAGRVGRERCRPLGYDMVVHCPELSAFAEGWRRIHDRPTRSVPGVRFYSHASCDHYAIDRNGVADALTRQALSTVDFPRLIEKAWADGVRVFLEHGAQAACSRWISRILGDRPHLAVPLDVAGISSLRQAANAAAALAAAGVAIDLTAFRFAHETLAPRDTARIRFSLRRPDPVLPPVTAMTMPTAPALRPILEAEHESRRHPAAPAAVAFSGSPLLHRIVADQQRLARIHREFLDQQSAVHQRFLALRSGSSVVEGSPRLEAKAPPIVKRAFSRADLETHASGRISSIFGAGFVGQDGHARQVRMPEPPLLLADRVTNIAGVAGSLGLGTVWTETDVPRDAWYLHAGRMPAGIMIESGQADLFLISWLGIDALNRGERVYRLLGCELVYHGGLPRPDDTLRYDIHVDGHAQQGEIRLFFFHYDCRIGGAVRLSVREGQAGFFTEAELADSSGVLWDASASEPKAARVEPPLVEIGTRGYDETQVRAFAAGRVRECFGDTHALAETHVETPRIADGKMLLMGAVAELDPAGGPWKRGYLRAVRRLDTDDWFYAGHFKNDPCMPGTLMLEGCLQTMAFYLAALGHTLEKDGWRFEPVPDLPYRLRCRGQATPQSRELVYEVFVSELISGPEPTLFADLLCTVDGVKAFHCQRMGLRLTPDTPMQARPRSFAGPADTGREALAEGLVLGFPAMLACAWGPPSKALGPAFASFDGARRMPRLPGPPYHFLSRVTKLDGKLGALRPGAEIEVEYDVPRDAWYFAAGAHGAMPFAVLLEVALQPCGWLALGTGIPIEAPEPLFFRNLDGTGTMPHEVRADVATLRTRVRLEDVSRSGGMSLLTFAVRTLAGSLPVFETTTGFGFFPREALTNQVGLPTTEANRAWLSRPSERDVGLPELRAAGPRLAEPQLLMLDRISGCWPRAGGAGLGRWRAEKDVRPEEWFFKAHFFQDPVQPGSLGLQALLQLLQCAMLERGSARGMTRPRFEPIASGRALVWKYRGQVVPRNRTITLELELTEIGGDTFGPFAVADAWLWVDGVRIYAAQGLAMRIVETETQT